jgi:hypothetical protein
VETYLPKRDPAAAEEVLFTRSVKAFLPALGSSFPEKLSKL